MIYQCTRVVNADIEKCAGTLPAASGIPNAVSLQRLNALEHLTILVRRARRQYGLGLTKKPTSIPSLFFLQGVADSR